MRSEIIPTLMSEATGLRSPVDVPTNRNDGMYLELIHKEFQKLQHDESLSSKSLFDLIDYCELLYEKLTETLDRSAIISYIRGYLIFNYFINSFIMIHFDGFDAFMESSSQDFVIYLNVFAFYMNSDFLQTRDQSIPLNEIRRHTLQYLVLNELLAFDVRGLYQWLFEYIEYLKSKDQAHSSPPDNNIIGRETDSRASESKKPERKPPSSPPPIPGTSIATPVAVSTTSPQMLYQFYNSPPKAHLPKIPPIPNTAPYPPTSLPPSPPKVPYPIIDRETPNAIVIPSVPQIKNGNSEPITTTLAHLPLFTEQSTTQISYENEPSLASLHHIRNPSSSNILGHQLNHMPDRMPDHTRHHNHSQNNPHLASSNLQQAQPSSLHSYGSNGSQYIPKESPKAIDLGVCGLRNFGASCYINLSLQVLLGLEPFMQVFRNLNYQKYVRDPKLLELMKTSKATGNTKLLAEAVAGLLRVFESHSSASVVPTKFIRVASLLKPDFQIPHQQQDAQEFIQFALERLHEELSARPQSISEEVIESYIKKWKIVVKESEKEDYMKWYRSMVLNDGDSPINDLFQGHIQNKLVCFKCKYESINYSSFSILSLPIPSSVTSTVNLSECLRYFIQDEVLTGKNAWNCPKCSKSPKTSTTDPHSVFTTKKSGFARFRKKSTEKPKTIKPDDSISIKTLDFIKLPPILLIHLSRFSMFNMTDKLDTSIQYPLQLKFSSNENTIRYKLSGLINHYGNLRSGHYTAIVNKARLPPGETGLDDLKWPFWCLFDDENIRHNLQHGYLGGPDSFHSRDVYVLCYERVL